MYLSSIQMKNNHKENPRRACSGKRKGQNCAITRALHPHTNSGCAPQPQKFMFTHIIMQLSLYKGHTTGAEYL